MDLYSRDSLYLTSPEMDDVRDIADQCPDDGGHGVAFAQALLAYKTTFDKWPGNNCLMINNQDKTISEVLVLNLIGNILITVKISSINSIIQLNTENLTSGIYLVAEDIKGKIQYNKWIKQ